MLLPLKHNGVFSSRELLTEQRCEGLRIFPCSRTDCGLDYLRCICLLATEVLFSILDIMFLLLSLNRCANVSLR